MVGHTISLSDIPSKNEGGGKAHNLGVMLSKEVPVPRGFVITCEAFSSFLEFNNLKIDTYSEVDITAGKFPEKLQEDILKKLYEFFSPDALVAVRSSGVSEDSSELSFSGMYSSFLDTSFDTLLEKIKECWASSRNERVQNYRQNNSGCALNPLMGVVVQEMVRSVISGVIFTRHPVTMDDSVFVVNCAQGLGEKVVSGHVNPDTIICKKNTGQIVSEKKGEESVEVPLAEIMDLAKRVEKAFGHEEGQDIEFAWDGKIAWAVQARPITTLPPPSSPSLKDDVCSNHETFDVFPEVVTPLTWSTFHHIVHTSLHQRYKQKIITYPQDRSMYELHWGRVYQNLTVADSMVKIEFGFDPGIAKKALTGTLSKPKAHDADASSILGMVKGLTRLLGNLWDSSNAAVRLGGVIESFSKWCKEREKELRNMKEHELTEENLNRLRKIATEKFCEFGVDYIDLNIRLQIFLAAVQVFLIIPSNFLECKPDFFTASLLANLGGVSTFEMNEKIKHLSTLVDDRVEEFLHEETTWADYRAHLQGTRFGAELDDFLENFGYRAVNELEASSVRWAEDPTYIFEQISTMVNLEKEKKVQAKKEDNAQTAEQKRKQTEDHLVSKMPFLQRYMGRWSIGKLQDFTRLRENAKCVLVQFISLERGYLIRAAKIFAAKKLLNREDDVFYLDLADLDALFGGVANTEFLEAKVRKGRAEYERLRKWVAPDMFVGGSPRVSPEKEKRPTSGRTLSGVGASCGIVEGTARVLSSPSERNKILSKDDILVCLTTDPAWTPLFACCSGLVSAHGGILSHGAIVAREFGIPAVLAVSDALEKISDGMKIQVDGNAGTVTIMSD